ncbi:YjbQ family protein [Pseudomonas sp. MF5691]|nr:YjbQ family protein [Pseudomonas sp. MF5691]
MGAELYMATDPDYPVGQAPGHFKGSLSGRQLSLPVKAGHLAMGTWQRVYLDEHPDHGGARKVLATCTVMGHKPLVIRWTLIFFRQPSTDGEAGL